MIFFAPEDHLLVRTHFPIDFADFSEIMTPLEALENLQAVDDKVVAAYKLGLAIGYARGDFGPGRDYQHNRPTN